MSQESGKSNLLDLEKIDAVLDEYEKFHGLAKAPDLIPNHQLVQSYLEMSRDNLEKVSPEEIVNIVYILQQYCFHLQRLINREHARHNWAEAWLQRLGGEKVGNYTGYSYQERLSQAIHEYDYLQKLFSIKLQTKERIDRLSFLPNRLTEMGNSLIEMCKARKRRSYEHETR
jgi:hypothetical protein